VRAWPFADDDDSGEADQAFLKQMTEVFHAFGQHLRGALHLLLGRRSGR